MSEPSVCAVMLTANRPEMAKRAIECFRRQTYPNKQIQIIDTGFVADAYTYMGSSGTLENEVLLHNQGFKATIGELRNLAVTKACRTTAEVPNIMIHWDDDDWSHPNRIAEQVALLQSSGADCVGYREMLFWREPKQLTNADVYGSEVCRSEGIERRAGCDVLPGEAWLYSNPDPTYALGTSLCYWRRTWQARPFEATSQGEDERFIRGLNVRPESAMACGNAFGQCGPAMVARIHNGNTSTGYRPELMERESRKRNPMWRRVPVWDEYCKSVMA